MTQPNNLPDIPVEDTGETKPGGALVRRDDDGMGEQGETLRRDPNQPPESGLRQPEGTEEGERGEQKPPVMKTEQKIECPRCHSPNVQRMDDTEEGEKGEGVKDKAPVMCKCKNCDNEFAYQPEQPAEQG